MKKRAFLVVGLLVALALPLLAGCGGEGGPIQAIVTGLYVGTAAGCGNGGPFRMLIDDNGNITGTMDISPLCANMAITGTYNPDGTVTFTATGCGITVTGDGQITQRAPGSWVFVGTGTWSTLGCNNGTWTATRVGATGVI